MQDELSCPHLHSAERARTFQEPAAIKCSRLAVDKPGLDLGSINLMENYLRVAPLPLLGALAGCGLEVLAISASICVYLRRSGFAFQC